MSVSPMPDVVVVGTKGEEGPFVAESLELDGEKLLIPTGAKVKAKVGDRDALVVTIELFAKSFRTEERA